MKKILLFIAISLMVGCNSNEARKKEIVLETEKLLDEINDNSSERKQKMNRMEFIGLELSTLNSTSLNDLTLEQRKSRAHELKLELQSLIAWGQESKTKDSLNLLEIQKLEKELEQLK